MSEFLVLTKDIIFWEMFSVSLSLLLISLCSFFYYSLKRDKKKDNNENANWIREDMLWEPDKDCNYETRLKPPKETMKEMDETMKKGSNV